MQWDAQHMVLALSTPTNPHRTVAFLPHPRDGDRACRELVRGDGKEGDVAGSKAGDAVSLHLLLVTAQANVEGVCHADGAAGTSSRVTAHWINPYGRSEA